MEKKIIEEYNDKLASVYDKATKGEFKWLAPRKLASRVLPLVKKGDIVLDLGCGTGQSAEPFIKKGCKVIGVDTSSEMLKLAKGRGFWKLYKHDISKGLGSFDFKNNYFDFVISSGTVEFIKNFKGLTKEASKFTKHGGYIAFTYELLLKNNRLQSKQISALGEGLVKPVSKILSFKVYRHTAKEIQEILEENKIKKIYSEKFIGYLKTKEKIPVYYGLFAGKKIN